MTIHVNARTFIPRTTSRRPSPSRSPIAGRDSPPANCASVLSAAKGEALVRVVAEFKAWSSSIEIEPTGVCNSSYIKHRVHQSQ